MAEWIAYASLEPIGEDKADLRFGMLMALIQNRHRGKNEPVAKPEQFMEVMNRVPKPPQDEDQQWQALKRFFRKTT